jgi:plasmid stability protein
MVRTQIALDSEDHRRAKRRAAERNISLAEYVREVVRRDLGGDERPKADIGAIFGLGASGGSDIAKHKDRYIGEAVEAEHLRKTGRAGSAG